MSSVVEAPKKSSIAELLGKDAENLLTYKAKVPASRLHLPGADYVDRVWTASDRSPAVLRHLQNLLNTGRLGGTGYVSILPVDQGIEHSGGASFAPNPDYFDPENIVKLAIEGGCNGTIRVEVMRSRATSSSTASGSKCGKSTQVAPSAIIIATKAGAALW